MCGNTRPKLLEVSYGRTLQHNKGLLTMSSPVPHSTEYRTHLERARHGGFQTLDVEHRITERPLDQPPGTTTEKDEDGDRRGRKRAKTEQMKTDPLWRRAKWQLLYS